MSETLTVPCSPLCCSSATDNQELPLVASFTYSLYSIFYCDFRCILTCDPSGWIKVGLGCGTRKPFQHHAVGHIFSFDRVRKPGRHFLCVSPQLQTHFTLTDSDPVCVRALAFYWDLLFCCLVFLSFIIFLQQKSKRMVSVFPLRFSCVPPPQRRTFMCRLNWQLERSLQRAECL